jgi:hypothetical protein
MSRHCGARGAREPGIQKLFGAIPGSRFARPGMTLGLFFVIARSESDEAIQTVAAERFWIASLRSQ